jgi:hypothetical protein
METEIMVVAADQPRCSQAAPRFRGARCGLRADAGPRNHSGLDAHNCVGDGYLNLTPRRHALPHPGTLPPASLFPTALHCPTPTCPPLVLTLAWIRPPALAIAASISSSAALRSFQLALPSAAT